MGARPSQFKRGGGFLNNVDGVIADYQFTDETPSKDGPVAFKPGRDPKTKKEKFHSLFCVLSVRVDGADQDVSTTLFVGGADDFEVSADGHTLTPVEDGRELGAGTSFTKFITSLVEAGFPETNLSETEINFEPIIGTRARFVQKVNEDDTKKLGKRKGKDGKEYARTDLVIDNVYEVPTATGAKAAKGAKTGPKTVTKAAGGKSNGKAVEVQEEDIKDLAGRALLEIVEAAGGSIVKAKLSMKTLTTPSLKGNDRRDDVRKWLFEDENLAELDSDGVITFNKTKQLIEAVA